MRNRVTFAAAFAAIAFLIACGSSAPEAPTVTSIFYDPPPPVVRTYSVESPQNGGTAQFGGNAGKVVAQFAAPFESLAAEVELSPDATGGMWVSAGRQTVDAASGVATIPFGLQEAAGVTETRRVRIKVAGAVYPPQDYVIFWAK